MWRGPRRAGVRGRGGRYHYYGTLMFISNWRTRSTFIINLRTATFWRVRYSQLGAFRNGQLRRAGRRSFWRWNWRTGWRRAIRLYAKRRRFYRGWRARSLRRQQRKICRWKWNGNSNSWRFSQKWQSFWATIHNFGFFCFHYFDLVFSCLFQNVFLSCFSLSQKFPKWIFLALHFVFFSQNSL